MRILIVGHGRMGRLIESLAPEYGCEVAGILTARSGGMSRLADAGRADVAIDFTVPSAVADNLRALVDRGISVVIGTTGWQADEARLKAVVAASRVGVLAAANFSLGMNLFQLIVEHASARFATHAAYGAFIHEAHHAAKKDAPSGTAIQLKAAMERAGLTRHIDVSATRAGSIPGTHTIGFDGPADTVTLTHTVRDRAVFARGALEAARWLQGRRGWFTMRDMLEGDKDEHVAGP